jgi:hypothetical protein
MSENISAADFAFANSADDYIAARAREKTLKRMQARIVRREKAEKITWDRNRIYEFLSGLKDLRRLQPRSLHELADLLAAKREKA